MWYCMCCNTVMEDHLKPYEDEPFTNLCPYCGSDSTIHVHNFTVPRDAVNYNLILMKKK